MSLCIVLLYTQTQPMETDNKEKRRTYQREYQRKYRELHKDDVKDYPSKQYSNKVDKIKLNSKKNKDIIKLIKSVYKNGEILISNPEKSRELDELMKHCRL